MSYCKSRFTNSPCRNVDREEEKNVFNLRGMCPEFLLIEDDPKTKSRQGFNVDLLLARTCPKAQVVSIALSVVCGRSVGSAKNDHVGNTKSDLFVLAKRSRTIFVTFQGSETKDVSVVDAFA